MVKIGTVIACASLTAGAALAGEAVRTLQVDIDCDGKSDRVFLSQNKRSASVRIVFGDTKRRQAKLRFVAAQGQQDAVCAMPVHLELQSLDYEPLKEEVPELPGFQRSKTCNSFALVDGECDSIHFYWDHEARELEWWR